MAQDVRSGDVVFRSGDLAYDLILIEAGRIEIFAPPTHGRGEELVTAYGPGEFLGELNLLTGQTAQLTARVVGSGRIHRISSSQFRRLMAEDPDLSDVLLRTFLTRRDRLRSSAAAHMLEIIGTGFSAEALALRTYVARQRLPHVWMDAGSLAGRSVMRSTPLDATDLPAALTHDRVLRRATPAELAELLGLSYRPIGDSPVDLTVVGAGPAGLAAAVYGASEGLDTVILDAVGTGGQAAASSRIENYLGFPSGISGSDLTQKATLQALKFGARLSSPCQAVALDTDGHYLRIVLADGTGIDTRAVVIATGAHYRALPLPRWAQFEGAGIYYAATYLEAQMCHDAPVTVVGGANSAGQAALYLASHGCPVTLAVRGSDLEAGMSSYLADRLVVDPRITVRTSTQVSALAGTAALEAITLTDRASRTSAEQPCRGLFCFIGADPATGWLHALSLDADGFIRTDVQLDAYPLNPVWADLGRAPLPFETSSPGVFAAGDVRSGSMKRVASSVGEGASAVHSVHTAIGPRV
ncbi:FAD-dependent oxidoreductase [Streptomyces sp. NBC_00344]|uniref:FAD-dependent oxidoreductase n=1 Tax=Streptomyces sp. NBC_00344 TaxID=2975720 RepID=UPI002E210233